MTIAYQGTLTSQLTVTINPKVQMVFGRLQRYLVLELPAPNVSETFFINLSSQVWRSKHADHERAFFPIQQWITSAERQHLYRAIQQENLAIN